MNFKSRFNHCVTGSTWLREIGLAEKVYYYNYVQRSRVNIKTLREEDSNQNASRGFSTREACASPDWVSQACRAEFGPGSRVYQGCRWCGSPDVLVFSGVFRCFLVLSWRSSHDVTGSALW